MVVFSLKGKLKLIIFVIILAVLVALAGYVFTNDAREIVSMVTGRDSLKPIYQVDTEEKKIAISFDACWGSERTDDIMDILDDNKVKATFFLVNIWLEDYPDKAKEVAERGHEIGLHSTTHPHFTQLSVEEMKEELTKNKEMVKKVTGYDAKLFRPPFGDYNNEVIKTARELDLTTIQWSVDSLDWRENLSAQDISKRILERVEKGSIILMHNDGQHTPEVIKVVLPELKRQGYSIVPISELLIKDDWYVDSEGIQRKK
ncbi:MAG TPA: polysaccharide deacetylase family protein [Clostridia bacterium]|nr:polysaccharide deacetylase family protein [Clostridia bacterium]